MAVTAAGFTTPKVTKPLTVMFPRCGFTWGAFTTMANAGACLMTMAQASGALISSASEAVSVLNSEGTGVGCSNALAGG